MSATMATIAATEHSYLFGGWRHDSNDVATEAANGEEECGLCNCCGLCEPLTIEERMYGAGACVFIGIVFGVMASVSVWSFHFTTFGVYYTLSNTCSIAGTFFFRGPAAQWKAMCEPHRIGTTAAYFLSIILVLLAALWLRNGFITLLAIFVQFCAGTWWTLSFIPGGQAVVYACCNSCGPRMFS